MKTVILAGGKGTRFIEQTTQKPKPMIEIGGKPILWHIMSIYGVHGYEDFVVACGYKGNYIRDYFANFSHQKNDIFVDMAKNRVDILHCPNPNWRLWLMETGLNTMTGGRLLRLKALLENETFMLTYGDGVSDIDITALVAYHKSHGKIATVTSVQPPGRFGRLVLDSYTVVKFSEKEPIKNDHINGGFFVFEPAIFDYLDNDETVLEREPMERLCADRQLMAYRHTGFWSHMDTVHEHQTLQDLWDNGVAPWKTWE